MASSAGREIDWATAEMRGGTLSVRVTGARPKGWVRQFERVLRLLGRDGARWGEIAVGKKLIKVSDVQEGSEEGLYELLESALLQVNTDFHERSEEEPGPNAGRSPDARPQAESTDSRMAETFRGFAERRANGARGANVARGANGA